MVVIADAQKVHVPGDVTRIGDRAGYRLGVCGLILVFVPVGVPGLGMNIAEIDVIRGLGFERPELKRVTEYKEEKREAFLHYPLRDWMQSSVFRKNVP